MASASATTAPRKRVSPSRSASTGKARPRGAGAGVAGRVRWDRVGRAAMLCVLVALLYLYASAGVHMLSTWRQVHRDRAVVSVLSSEHAHLLRQHAALSKRSTLEAEARQLGMMKKNEQPYVISGLPND